MDVQQQIAAVQAYLRTHTLEDFDAEHGIRGKSDGQHLLLDYNQITVDWNQPYGYVCRGLVLDAVTFEVLGMGLSKFFNAGESRAAAIDWSTAAVFEKIDGTMLNRWWSPHTQRFEYSTRFQLPGDMAVNEVQGYPVTWTKLTESCLSTIPYLHEQPQDETWTFEICGQANRVVVSHREEHAKLLAIRNRVTLQERWVEGLDCIPQAYRFNNAAEVAEFANKHAAVELEGFVVADAQFNRLKIKSDEYLKLHRLKDGVRGVNAILLLIKGGDYEEILAHFPEYRPDFERIAQLIDAEISEHSRAYEGLKGIESQKEFAIAVEQMGLRNTAALFQVRSGKAASIRASFLQMLDSRFCKMFGDAARAVFGGKYADADS